MSIKDVLVEFQTEQRQPLAKRDPSRGSIIVNQNLVIFVSQDLCLMLAKNLSIIILLVTRIQCKMFHQLIKLITGRLTRQTIGSSVYLVNI